MRSKDGVASALAELIRLPILSVVEEKLLVRQELIEWKVEAERLMTMVAAPSALANTTIDNSNSSKKLPFVQIKNLHRELLSVLDLTSNRRAKVCENLRHSPFIEEEVRTFVVADEKVICPKAGVWVRDQFQRGSQWIAKYRSITSTLIPSQGFTLDVKIISSLLQEYDDAQFNISFSNEYSHLQSLQQSMTAWTSATHQIVLSNTLTLQERCDQLLSATRKRPNGATKPTDPVIHLWLQVYTWRISLSCKHHEIGTMTEGLDEKKMWRLICLQLAPLIIEGQDFLIAAEKEHWVSHRPFLAILREKTLNALSSIDNSADSNTHQPIRKTEILESALIYGKAVLDCIVDLEADRRLGSSLLIARQLFFVMMVRQFFEWLQHGLNFVGNLDDAKALLCLCPHEFVKDEVAAVTRTLFTETKVQLQQLTHDAEQLESQSSIALTQCTALLQTENCYLHELQESLLALSEVKLNFNSNQNTLAAKLLTEKDLGKKLDEKIKGLTWLVSAFAHDLFCVPTNVQNTDNVRTDRIYYTNLQALYNTLPTDEYPDKEIVRVSTMVKDLWTRANEWHATASSIISASSVRLGALNALMENDILSMVRTLLFAALLFATFQYKNVHLL